MGEKSLVEIVEDKGVLKFTDEKGTTHKYYRPIRTFFCDAKSIDVCSSLAAGNEDSAQPRLKRYLKANASLKDYGISVIGAPGTKSREVVIRIHSRTAEDHAEAVERRKASPKDEEASEFRVLRNEVPYIDAVLGFNSADWEIGNDDEWYLQLYVSESALGDMANSILRGEVKSFCIGIRLIGAYVDDEYAPPAGKVDWFLRPRKSDGDVTYPETAYGMIHVLHIEHGSAKIGMKELEAAEDQPMEDQAGQSQGMRAAVAPKPSAVLEVVSRFLGGIQLVAGLVMWGLWIFGAYTVYRLWGAGESRYANSEVAQALFLGWVAIAMIAVLRGCQIAIGWIALQPIRAAIQGIDLRDPAVSRAHREETQTHLIFDAISLGIAIAIPLLIAHFRFRYFG